MDENLSNVENLFAHESRVCVICFVRVVINLNFPSFQSFLVFSIDFTFWVLVLVRGTMKKWTKSENFGMSPLSRKIRTLGCKLFDSVRLFLAYIEGSRDQLSTSRENIVMQNKQKLFWVSIIKRKLRCVKKSIKKFSIFSHFLNLSNRGEIKQISNLYILYKL